MRHYPVSAEEVARFLAQNPQFFLERSDLLLGLRLPHPRTDKLISLAERQTLLLREKNQRLEKQIHQFLHNARENELISQALLNWTCELLAKPQTAAQICEKMCASLQKQYGLQSIELRLWWDQHPFPVADTSPNIKAWVKRREAPYTGPVSGSPAGAWFKQPMVSMALIPLYAWDKSHCVGALALGSDMASRFTYNIGTDFLVAMGKIFMAMLTRYYEPQKHIA
ncbi:DUF484 family protein [Paenalcaligenes hermetiae]|uniref:DUF484 family protein n=1 Tax=Paenalcaligenes hermetiae TaxID=1157987 RepID=A0ABP9M5S4_9BURK